jgi:hypothetical protein
MRAWARIIGSYVVTQFEAHEGSVLQGWRGTNCGDWLGCREGIDDVGPVFFF